MGSITAPTVQMMRLAREWEAIYPSAVFAGINGDAAHYDAPGKHLSRSINIDKFGRNCWPVVHAKDKLGPSDKSCAIDMSMSKADMTKCHTALRVVYVNRGTDPRAAYFYAFNGWDGTGSPGRYNFVNGSVSIASSDHTWHEHGETFYGYVDSDEMVRAWVSALKRETVSQYLGEDDFVEQADFDKLMDTWLITRTSGATTAPIPTVYGRLKAFPVQYNGNGTPEAGMSVLNIMTGTYKMVEEIAKKVDIDETELAAIKDAARQGASESAQAIVDGVLAGLPEGDIDETDVEQALRNVLLKGVEPEVPVE